MRVLFAHGLESGPHGRKYHALVGAGHRVDAPDCQGKELADRIGVLIKAMEAPPLPEVVVGSSFGGIASLVAALHARVPPPALVLCAPALQLPAPPPYEIELSCPCPTTIIHGTGDEVISIDLSRKFAETHGATLTEVNDDHSLAESLWHILEAVRLSQNPE